MEDMEEAWFAYSGILQQVFLQPSGELHLPSLSLALGISSDTLKFSGAIPAWDRQSGFTTSFKRQLLRLRQQHPEAGSREQPIPVQGTAAAAPGLLSAKEYVKQLLPQMPRRTSDRASTSLTLPRNCRTFGGVEEILDFNIKVNEFVDWLPDTPKIFNRLIFRAKASGVEPEVMLSGAADESYVRSCLIHTLQAVSEVAAELQLDTEFVDGGSGRSASYTDMLVRKRGTSQSKDASRLVMGVLEVKGPWQLKLDGTMSLQAALADDNLGPSVAKVIQQAYGDAVTDECPLMLVSNWHTTILLQRNDMDVRDKKLRVAQWTWDSTDVPPLGAFLYILKLAHELWHSNAKQRLPSREVPITPSTGYVLQLSSRQVQLSARFGGWRAAPLREQPERISKRRSQAGDAGHAAEEGNGPAQCSPTPGSDLEPSWSGNSSVLSSPWSSSAYSSSDGGAGHFDAVAWAEAAKLCSSAAAVENLPVLPFSYAPCSNLGLSSSSSTRRVFQGSVDGQPAAFKFFNPNDQGALSAFVAEASAYVRLSDLCGVCLAQLLTLGRRPHSGVPVLGLSLGKPVSRQMLQQHAAAARDCLRHLHAAGVAHGDVRAENFLLIGDQVVLSDLESCRTADGGACQQDWDQLESLLGTY